MKYFDTHAREPMSCFTHWIGLLCAIAGCPLLLARAVSRQSDAATTLSALVFGLSLVSLYAASSLYHFYTGSESVLVRLRKLDHSIIYLLIAGSYAPIVVHCMQPENARRFLLVIWAVALLGIVLKVCWLRAPRWLYTSLYLLMGWAVLLDWRAFSRLEPGCLRLVAAGGISYSIGAVVYILKRPNLGGRFGFHEIFHLFILLGSLLHFIAIYCYVL